MTNKQSIREIVATADWSTITQTIKQLKIEIPEKDHKSRRLKKKTSMIKMLLYEKTRNLNGDNSIDCAFFVSAIKTIRKLEQEYTRESIKKEETLIFLSLLLEKFHKQKLTVKKHMATIEEFRKLKRVVEDDYQTVPKSDKD
ncbi:hypothetical protein HY990_05350 [Candidatus Micrarchaeota archaeon]|nr:hypothetical protein [Candidatus Micrarchaeota archaeon]